MKIRLINIVMFLLILFSLSATDYVAITEIMYDTPLNENTAVNPHNFGEFVELYNAGENDVNLSGWSLNMISPNQTYVIPASTVLPAHSFLVIAYGTYNAYGVLDDECEEWDYCYSTGWSDFHEMYQVSPDTCTVIFQTSLILPNNNHTLLLKDAQGLTRDSVCYGSLPGWDTMYAPNTNASDFNTFGDTLYSVKRNNIHFHLNGVCYDFNPSNWISHSDPSQLRNTVGWSQIIMNTNISMSPISVEICNYMIEITPTAPQNSISVNSVSQNIPNALVTVNYYDGLMREQQTLQKNLTPSGRHLINFTQYDAYNRLSKQWLPTPTEMTMLNLSTYQGNASQFYNNENRYFTEYIYSANELTTGVKSNELSATQYAGSAWNGHSLATETFGNAENSVKLFIANANGSLQNAGYYAERTLICERITDEDGKQTETYTNRQGQVVLQRKGSNNDTYFVYNALGQLSFVLPPLASSALGQGTYSISNEALKKYAYIYRYDQHGNCIYKRLPGCEPVEMIYDKAGRLVYSADGEQEFWGNPTILMYDKFGRSVYSLENEVQNISYFYSDFYDAVIDTQAVEQCFNEYAQAHELEDTHYSDSYITESENHLLHTVSYYDNYAFLTGFAQSDSLQYDDSFENIYGSYSGNTKGLLTGRRTYMLTDDNTYTTSVNYYDYLGRIIQQRSTNHHGGCDITYTAYNFSGLPTRIYTTKSASGGIYTRELYTYTYDNALRLISTTYQLNDDTPMTLNAMRYDELGRLACKRIYDNMDSVKYSYNIRNQLTRIKAGSGFEENMYYYTNNPYNSNGVPCYNGNISSSTWTYGNKTNGYNYFYDNLNRLTSEYSILNGIFSDYAYTEYFVYDKHGNITQLYRWNSEDIMDGLEMTYNGNKLKAVSNENQMVLPSYNAKHYQNLSNLQTEFEYDNNGNLVKDYDRNICKIQYNSLNLPTRIQFRNGNQIAHLYDAAGNRVKTTYYTRKSAVVVPFGNMLYPENNISDYNVVQYAYNGNISYKRSGANSQWMLDLIRNPEGFNRFYTQTEHYPFYYIKDHLGNIRELWVYPGDNYNELVQRMQYYPSGLPWDTNISPGEQPYKYNGKEFIEMHGLDEYDSKARWYYPAIARTSTMDPLCEKYYDISPYAWCGNNFVNVVDLNGKWSVSVHGSKNRAKYPYSLYQVSDNRGNVIFQTVVKTRGIYRNRTKENGDTPNGKYKLNKWRKDVKFGKNPFIDQTYIEGEGKGDNTDNRDRMHTHGGGDIMNEKGKLIGLKGTLGCFRMADEDIVELKNIIELIEATIPTEEMTILTFEDDIAEPISEDDFVETHILETLGNGTILLPEIIVQPQDICDYDENKK